MSLRPTYIRYATTDSTQARALAAQETCAEGTVWTADFQTAGRGQGDHLWESAAGENLCLSVLFKPSFLHSRAQAALSEAMALGVCAYLEAKGLEAAIKWPNDIYIGNRKIAGLLIAHSHRGDCLARSVVGLGLNLNQLDFPAHLPNPTSLRRALGAETPPFDRQVELEALVDALFAAYAQLRAPGPQALHPRYEARLYLRGLLHRFTDLRNGREVEGRICGVSPQGRLLIQEEGGAVQAYAFQEIRFLPA